MNEVWDLSPIYKGFEDPAFDADMQELKSLVDQIVAFSEGLPQAEPLSGLTQGIALEEQFSVLISKLAGFASLRQAADTARALSVDMASIDLQAAQLALAEITGDEVEEKLLDNVFGMFCVGK